MDTITYENIQIMGIPFRKIGKLQIRHRVNDHGYCHIEGEMTEEQARDIIRRVDERFALKIETKAAGQPSVLFYGNVQKISMEEGNSYASLIVDGITSSGKLDRQKRNQTYQNTTQTHGQLLNKLLGDRGSVQVLATDRPVKSFIIQCDETDWEFTIRMASRLGAPASVNILSPKPQIYIGIPPEGRTVRVDTVSFGSARDVQGAGGVSQSARTYAYAYLGDCLALNGKNYRIKSMQADLVDGLLECSYDFCAPAGFSVPQTTNGSVSGRMLRGIVKKVEADKVQVHFASVDSSYDEGGDCWFPYSTAYSSQDGSGWYSMPAENDEVRVFFPSGDEGEAFAAGAVAKNVRANVKDKAWSGTNGKEILMTADGLVITCKDQKIYIKLSDADGISIISDANINVTSGSNVNISAGDTIKILAENEVVLGTAESHINIRKEGISATGNNIIMI